MKGIENNSWLVVRTKPHQEMFTQINLVNKGIEVYHPRYEDKVVKWGKVQPVIKSLFPGYIFSRFASDEIAYSMKWTPGVHSILMQCDKYAFIDDSIIQEIKTRSGSKGFIRPSKLKPGTTVIIKKGPMKDYVGIFQNYLNDCTRIKILLNLLKFQSYLIIEEAFVEVA